MPPEIEKIKLYLRIKWWVIASAALLIGTETLFGVVSFAASLSSFIALAMASASALFLQLRIEKPTVPIHISLNFDFF